MDQKSRKIDKILAAEKVVAEQNQEFFHDIMSNSRDALVRYNFVTERPDYLSDSIEALTGYSVQELSGQNIEMWIDNIHPDDRYLIVDIINDCKNDVFPDTQIHVEYRFRHKDGHWIWISDTTAVVRNEQGRIHAGLGVLRDITETKLRQQQLDASQERFKCLAEASFEAIMIHEDRKVIDVNQQFIEMHGYTLKELQAFDILGLIAPEYRDVVLEKRSSDFEEPYEVVGLRKDGSRFPLEIRSKSAIINGQSVRIAIGRDLTEQKRIEASLQTSRERFKRLSEASFEAIIIHEQGKILDANQECLNQTGYTLEEIKNLRNLEMVAPQSRVFVKEMIASGYEGVYDAFGLKKDGAVFPIQIHAKNAVMDGRPVRIVAVRDMTFEHQQAQQLKESEELYRTVVENSDNAIMIIDRNGTYQFNNTSGLRAIGLSYDEFVGKNCSDLFPEEFADKKKEEIKYVLETGKVLKTLKCPMLQGQERWHEMTMIPLRNEQGQFDRVLSIAKDIHEEKLLNEQLKHSEKKYKQLYENAPVALFRSALDGTLLNCNRACLAFFGHSVEEPPENYLNKVCVTDYYENKERRDEFIEALKKDGCVEHFEVQLKRADNSIFWASISATLFLEAGYIEGTLYDITLKKILTKTERKILRFLLEGMSNKQIAKMLARSVRTIEDHRASIMRKFGVDNAFDLAKKSMNSFFEESEQS